MIAVIQCAAKKRRDAGRLQMANGNPVDFVAHPECAPSSPARAYMHPDSPSGDGRSWRVLLEQYNKDHSRDNPLKLCSAYQLYENKVYARLVDRFGLSKTFILSAGWGLIAADYLTPFYDITFTSSAERYKKRRFKKDVFKDFVMLPNTKEDIIFFGSKEYLPLFCSLTQSFGARRIVFFNSRNPPVCDGSALERFTGSRHTNWQYDCANAFLDGKINI